MNRSPAILKKRRGGGGGLGFAAIAYIGVDYLRFISPVWHDRLQPALWTVLAVTAIIRIPFYKHWSSELRSALPFIFAMLFLLSALLFEAISALSVTAVLGLDWNKTWGAMSLCTSAKPVKSAKEHNKTCQNCLKSMHPEE